MPQQCSGLSLKNYMYMQGNAFSNFFAGAAEKVGAATKHDGFDSTVIQVA